MAVTVAKPVAAAKPVAKPVAPPAKPAPVQSVAPLAAEPAATVDPAAADDDDANDAKEPRKTRKDFSGGADGGWSDFCDYKVGLAEANVVKWTARVELWKNKKVNKDADAAVKAEKKAEKLIGAFIAVQMRLGMTEAQIRPLIEQFRTNLAAAKVTT